MLTYSFLFTSCQIKITEYTDDSQSNILYEYHKNCFGQLNGPFVEYKENGNMSRKGTYKNNKLNGDYYEYYNNGKLKIHAKYEIGLFWNIIVYQDINGNKLDYGTLENGNGIVCTYSSKGKIRAKGEYVDGKPHGEWQMYSNAGYSHSVEYHKDKSLGKTSVENRPPNL
jgi:antitoxin component YwqK of YwqJK toxin-antitoxin module